MTEFKMGDTLTAENVIDYISKVADKLAGMPAVAMEPMVVPEHLIAYMVGNKEARKWN